jgi:hypothetical protein
MINAYGFAGISYFENGGKINLIKKWIQIIKKLKEK